MKLISSFLDKVGIDKALHFVIGALIDALLFPFGIGYTILGIFIVWILSCVKELIDSYEEGNKCDWWDALIGTAGASCMCMYYIIVS